jgi:hypothetical protein
MLLRKLSEELCHLQRNSYAKFQNQLCTGQNKTIHTKSRGGQTVRVFSQAGDKELVNVAVVGGEFGQPLTELDIQSLKIFANFYSIQKEKCAELYRMSCRNYNILNYQFKL